MGRDLVIGSGPAGVAAAAALIGQGRQVTMFDVGGQLEPSRAAVQVRMGGVEPEHWSAADIASVQGPRHADRTEDMRPFGSDFSSRDSVGIFGPDGPPPWLGLRPSFAKGGLSNGWGASVLPYRAEDIEDWPIGPGDLGPHYDAIGALIPIAAKPDALAGLFPMQTINGDRSLPLSSQASVLLDRLDRRRDRLWRKGVHFGRARQAVSAACRRCRMCLYGCPYGLIFNSAATVEHLIERGLTYQPDRYVTRFEEQADGVRLTARDMVGGQTVEYTGDRVFVAAGVLPTTQLVLSSLGEINRPVMLRDSQHFFLPMLQTWRPRPDPATELSHSLTQIFLEIIDPSVSAHTVHIQIYTHNDLYAVDMRQRFGVFARAMNPLIEHLSRRLIVAQGFLHSDDSPQIKIRLIGSGESMRLDFGPGENSATSGTIAAARKKMCAVARSAGLVPLSPLSRVGAPGSSFHCGGTFPMRRNPVGLETDTLGRPAGLRRVFLVDASVFPSIPATTITLSVMANSHRIASEAATEV